MRSGSKSAKALLEGGIDAIRTAIEEGSVEAGALVAASLAAIEGSEGNAVIETCPQALDETRPAGPLAGVPVLVKDAFVDGGRAPTVASRATASWLNGTAEVLKRLRTAGAAVVGYANLHEWMVGTSSLVSAFGPVVNPLDPALIAGGSSGGCAAALAEGLVPLALGSDAGGSIRIPAACCGVVGFKPTLGLVPTEGFADHGSLVDHVGPMARSVEDAALLLEILAGRSFDEPPVERLRVGIARRPFFEDVAPEVAAAVDAAVEALGPRVASVTDVAISGAAEAPAAVAPFILKDVAGLLSAYAPGWRELLEPETALVVGMGAEITNEQRAQAEETRATVRSGWERAFEEVDVVVSPTLPGRIATVADRTVTLPSGVASAELSYLAWNGPMNLGGVPCLSLPCGTLDDGQTVNLSLTAARGRDADALALGRCVEEVTEQNRSGA